ncbi:hypothetical protein PHYBLDRAFT_161100 [Phycomyces blakesleeanus NRRL 1555(-)]|uniref:Uncharacterized protein n=1 Tax=Phycomyces blakesleeanus (strain ATCC 8743b / DSM 1359 / FGSC 10004 / NBRC 33097 / NRRL 1555) TaxID=763407 RepID=A0A167QY38_PHYB8|nr:hypothetical protein PHYBLDRAFT_161100 [Phycomyces blakesleeanus NRRL 1555(-)]OAD80454.1 hypothetical protein PHYBLDRAFT_161100 [Phycomyces blakesleeanus NRRL 1555(-)]|eukprot:XP_018298494.1 hypothetical protein PHYBLDRAFT_161100 [Phycomyces blakesleeanus NRRL 1555(-)]
MNIQFLFENGKKSVVDEEQFLLEMLSSHTQYLAQLPPESEKEIEDKVKFFKLLFERCLSGPLLKNSLGFMFVHHKNGLSIMRRNLASLRNGERSAVHAFSTGNIKTLFLSVFMIVFRPPRQSNEEVETSMYIITIIQSYIVRPLWPEKGTPEVVTVSKTRATIASILGASSAEGLIKRSLGLSQPPLNKTRKRGDGVGHRVTTKGKFKNIDPTDFTGLKLPSLLPFLLLSRDTSRALLTRFSLIYANFNKNVPRAETMSLVF